MPFATGVAVQRYLSAEDGLAAARDEGCSHWYIDASLLEEMPANWSTARRRGLHAAAADQGMTPVLHGNFRAPLATEIPEVRAGALDYVRSEIRLAADLGAESLVIHGGAFVEPRPTKSQRDAALGRFLELLAVVVREADDQGVTVWLENLSFYPKYSPFSYVFTRIDDFSTAVEAIPGIKFILDIGHANVNQSLAFPALEMYSANIAALALSNNSGRHDSHLSLADGTIDTTEFIEIVHRLRWSGVLAFETRNDSVVNGLRHLADKWRAVERERGPVAVGGGAHDPRV